MPLITTSSGVKLENNAGSGSFAVDNSGNLALNGPVLQPTLGSEVLVLQSTATNDDPRVGTSQNRIATTDATPTTLHTVPITASRTYIIQATVIARRTGGAAGTADDGAAYRLMSAYTTKAGTVTLLGVMENINPEDVAAYACALVISGTDVIVQVTGVLNTTITWHLVECKVAWVGT